MRVLIIEDEVMLADNIKLGLEDEGFAVDVIHNGNEAYEHASVEEYDAIILDRMLPKMDGLTICQNLRKDRVFTPILMLTARSGIEDKISGLDAGADDYLIKPFVFDELLARLRSLIRRAARKEPVMQVGSLTVDPKVHLVTRAKKKLNLPEKNMPCWNILCFIRIRF